MSTSTRVAYLTNFLFRAEGDQEVQQKGVLIIRPFSWPSGRAATCPHGYFATGEERQLTTGGQQAIMAILPATASQRRHQWRPTGLFRKDYAEGLGNYSMDECMATSSTSFMAGTEKAKPKHDPYHGGWLLQPPSGRWILEHGRPKCIPSLQSTGNRLPLLGSKSHSKKNAKQKLAERTVQVLPQNRNVERVQEPSFDPEVAQQQGSESMSAGPLAVSPDIPGNSGISNLAASCRSKQQVHSSSRVGPPSQLIFTQTQGDQRRKTGSLGSDAASTAENVVVDTLDDILKPLDTTPSEVTKLPRFNWTGRTELLENQVQESEFDEKKRRHTASLGRASLGRHLPRVPHPRRAGTDVQLGEKTNGAKASLSAELALNEGHDRGDLAISSLRPVGDLDEFEKPADLESTETDVSPNKMKSNRQRNNETDRHSDNHLGLPGISTSTSTRRASMVSNLDPASHTQRQQQEIKDKAARKQDREIRSQVKNLRDSLHRSATETFEPEIWEGCGIHSEHLKKRGLVSFLGTSLAQKAENEDTEASSSAEDHDAADDTAAKGRS